MYGEVFPTRLLKARDMTGFTQIEVARELGISQQNISHYENGDREPDIETLALLADFYGVSTDWLIGIASPEFVQNPKWDGIKIHTTGFPEKMKLARSKTGLSQAKVAKELEITRSNVAKYELGMLEPSIETLAKICVFYKVSCDWLLGLEKEFVHV